jgi:hypothetical protein
MPAGHAYGVAGHAYGVAGHAYGVAGHAYGVAGRIGGQAACMSLRVLSGSVSPRPKGARPRQRRASLRGESSFRFLIPLRFAFRAPWIHHGDTEAQRKPHTEARQRRPVPQGRGTLSAVFSRRNGDRESNASSPPSPPACSLRLRPVARERRIGTVSTRSPSAVLEPRGNPP